MKKKLSAYVAIIRLHVHSENDLYLIQHIFDIKILQQYTIQINKIINVLSIPYKTNKIITVLVTQNNIRILFKQFKEPASLEV